MIDIDYHHGNGTQEIFWERDDVQFVSLHGTPETEYPWFLGYADERGEGRGEGPHAQPAAAGRQRLGRLRETRSARRSTPSGATRRMRLSCRSASIPSRADPISAFKLEGEHYPRIGGLLAGLALPTVLVQEGGYAVAEIGANVVGVLGAFASRPA